MFADVHRFSSRCTKWLEMLKTMFYVFWLFALLYRHFRLSRVSQTREHKEIYRLVSKILNFTPCGSAFDRFCLEALRVAENHEKQCFKFFCLFTPLYRHCRLSRVSQTQEREEIYRLVSKILNFTPCGSVFNRFCVEARTAKSRTQNGGEPPKRPPYHLPPKKWRRSIFSNTP